MPSALKLIARVFENNMTYIVSMVLVDSNIRITEVRNFTCEVFEIIDLTSYSLYK